jgi:hypothetical protein
MRFLLPFLLLLPAAGQAPAERGRQVIDAAVKALGGPAFLEMKDRVESGRGYVFARNNLSGLARLKIYTRYLVRPEPPPVGFIGVRERQAQGKDEDVVSLFTPEECYETTYRGAKPLPPDMVNRWKESLLHNILYILRMRLGEPGLTFDFMGTEIFENQPVDIVNVVDAENRQVKVYFHQTLHVPVRQEWSRRDPLTKDLLREVTVFSKWKEVKGGIQWPWVLRRERNGERIAEIYDEAVSINEDLPDNLFTISGSTKMIEKKK